MHLVEKLNMRKEQAAESRRSMLSAALALFAENGYNATTVRSIHHKMGMKAGLLYHYFPGGKREILQVLVDENREQIIAKLQSSFEGLDDSLPLEDTIEEIYQNWFRIFNEHRDIIKILLRENQSLQLLERDKIAEIVNGGDNFLPKLLRQRAERGEIREIDYISSAEILKAVLLHYFLAIITSISSELLHDGEHRRRLLAYQVALWK